jgi:hypothetical protein
MNQHECRTVALAIWGAIGVAFLATVSSVVSGIILQDREAESRVRDVQQENRALQVEVLHLRNRQQPPGPIPDDRADPAPPVTPIDNRPYVVNYCCPETRTAWYTSHALQREEAQWLRGLGVSCFVSWTQQGRFYTTYQLTRWRQQTFSEQLAARAFASNLEGKGFAIEVTRE